MTGVVVEYKILTVTLRCFVRPSAFEFVNASNLRYYGLRPHLNNESMTVLTEYFGKRSPNWEKG